MDVLRAGPAQTFEHTWRAMGSNAHLVVVGADPSAVATARNRVARLESRWSRFIATSEVSQANAAPGVPMLVSADTLRLAERAAFAAAATGGWFDPLLARSMEDLGYDRDFSRVGTDPSEEARGPVTRGRAHRSGVVSLGSPGVLQVDHVVGSVRVPIDAALDPGGLGKGLAADMVVEELVAAGARGAMLNLGGDLAVAGTPPTEHGWVVGVEDPFDTARHCARVTIERGGVCTSSRFTRRWMHDGEAVHHLLDPTTRRPVANDIAAVTVVAGAAWWAEVLTKVIFAAGVDIAARWCDDAHAYVVHLDGSVSIIGDADVFDRRRLPAG